MKFLDFFFYKTFKFALWLKKDSGDSKWSAFLFTSAYLSISFIFLTFLIGLTFENSFNLFLKEHSLSIWMLAFALSPVLLSLRYYRDKNIINKIEFEYLSSNKKLYSFFIYLYMILVPIFTFILYRL